MNRSLHVKKIFQVILNSDIGITAGDAIRLAALIVETAYDEPQGYRDRGNVVANFYSQPVDVAIADGGWRILVEDGRSNSCIFDEEPEAADITAKRLQRLIGKVRWPRIVDLD